MMNARVLDAVIVLLAVATGVTWYVGESGSAGPVAVLTILGIALVKGWLIIREFMALRWANFFWRAIVVGWLFTVLAMIMITYWKALH